MDEVPPLAPVLEDPRRAAGRQGRSGRTTPPRRTACPAASPGRTRCDSAAPPPAPGRPGPRGGEVLLGDLGVGVDVARPERRVLGHELRGQRLAAARAARLEPARVEVGRLPRRRRRGQPVLGARVGALAVDDHRRGQHQPADARPGHRGKQDRGPQVVAARIQRRVVEVDAEPDHRRQVADRADAAQRRRRPSPRRGRRRARTRSRDRRRTAGGRPGGRTAAARQAPAPHDPRP